MSPTPQAFVTNAEQKDRMETVAFTMQLLPGTLAEYRRRHDEIWPELIETLQAAGISDYFIFADPQSGRLFGHLKRAGTHTMDRLPGTAIMQRWWAYMADLMETNPDNSPVVGPLSQVFHLP